MMVNLLFYSTQGFVYFAVVFFVVAADFANERHQHKETTTDNRNHDFNGHGINFLPLNQNRMVLFEGLAAAQIRHKYLLLGHK